MSELASGGKNVLGPVGTGDEMAATMHVMSQSARWRQRAPTVSYSIYGTFLGCSIFSL